MSYNKNNSIKWYQYVVSVYEAYKKPGVFDTHIVRFHFPRHYIFISDRHWAKIKGEPLPRDGRFKIEPMIDTKIHSNRQK